MQTNSRQLSRGKKKSYKTLHFSVKIVKHECDKITAIYKIEKNLGVFYSSGTKENLK